MRVWLSHCLRVIEHFLQEDYAYWFLSISPQTRQAEPSLLFIIYGFSSHGPNLGIHRPSAPHGRRTGSYHSSCSWICHPLSRVQYFPQRDSPFCTKHHCVHHPRICITRHLLDCLPLQAGGRNLYCVSLVQSTCPPYPRRRDRAHLLGTLDVQ